MFKKKSTKKPGRNLSRSIFNQFKKKSTLLFIASTLILNISTSAALHQVDPSMSRNEIQKIIDLAADNDTIIFLDGIFDFSTLPLSRDNENSGALKIVDKCLTLQGRPQTILIGPKSLRNRNGSGDVEY